VLVPAGAVGAVGVPVNDGDAIVALNNMSAVFAVMLEVLDVILVSKAASAFVALVISAVMLAVLDAINVGNVVIVVELTPPTLFTVGNDAVPPRSLVN
jgi:hypothetical protein